jgi:AsmA protein
MRRALWIGTAAVAVVVALLVGLATWTLDPASLKPRLIEAAEQATGRAVTIAGPIGIKLALMPTITMADVTLANPPGFSRPEMVKVGSVELGLALMPLLRHRFEVDHVTLVHPDILLETDPAGHPNWVFTRGPPKAATIAPMPAGPPTQNIAVSQDSSPQAVIPPQSGAAQRHFTPVLRNLTMVDGRVGWIDRSGHQYAAGIERLTLTEPAVPLADITGTINFEGWIIRITARTGALEDLRPAFAAAPWPVSVRLESDRTTLKVTGQIEHPLRASGYRFAVDADVPDPPSLAPLLPRLNLGAVNLGALGEISAHAEVSDSDGPRPTVSALRVNVASARLDAVRRGALLTDVTLNADAGSPLNVAARLTLDGVESRITGTVGDLPWLVGGRSAPVAVELNWSVASAQGTVRGTIQAPRRLAGYDLNVALDMPDPSLVFPDAPPGLKSVVLRTRLTDSATPTRFQLTSSVGDLQGELAVTHQGRWSVEGQIASYRLDFDRLRGAAPVDAATPGPATAPDAPAAGPSRPEAPETPATRSPATGSPPLAAKPAAPAASAGPAVAAVRPAAPGASAGPGPWAGTPAAANNGPLIPETRLPFDLIHAVDGDIRFAFFHVLLDGADFRRISGTVSAKDGLLRVDPFNIAAPGQRLSGVLVADAASNPPRVHLSVEAPGLTLRPLLAALGLPEVATGSAAVRADLSGQGDSPHAIAATLNGWAEVAVEGGQLDAQTMNAWLGPLRLLRLEGPDVTDLRCFAVRADARSGVLAIDPMAFNTPALIIEGGGDVDLRDETMALRLRPRGKLGGTGIAVPVKLSGPIRDPSAKVDISPRGFGAAALSGLLLGGKDIMGAAGGGDPCPAALARAREGGPEAPPAARP